MSTDEKEKEKEIRNLKENIESLKRRVLNMHYFLQVYDAMTTYTFKHIYNDRAEEMKDKMLKSFLDLQDKRLDHFFEVELSQGWQSVQPAQEKK